jgi:beta-barrel assembly-enhancing protease
MASCLTGSAHGPIQATELDRIGRSAYALRWTNCDLTMSDLFFNLGHRLGSASLSALRKSRWVWKSLTGSEAESIRAEGEFGSALAAELRLKTGVSHQAEDVNLARDIGRKLSACVRNKLRTFHVEVLLDPAPTGLALPGGFIFLSTGLLDLCKRDPDELAFVVGHEIGHIVRGHALERMVNRIGVEGLSAILSRGLLNPVLRQSGIKWLESAHSRQAELEADEFGVKIAGVAGYQQAAAIGLLQRLAALRETPRGIGDYFASHPPEAERVANIQAVLASIRPRPAPRH